MKLTSIFMGLAVVSTATGCTAKAAQVHVVEKEYSISAPGTPEVGKVQISVRNAGTKVHELVLLRTDLPADALPVEGRKVQEDAKGIKSIGEIEDIEAGETKSATFDLKPGRYVFVCNIEGHYESGMRAAFDVR